MDGETRSKVVTELMSGLPDDVVKMLSGAAASGNSLTGFLPVLRHLHRQMGDLIERIEAANGKKDTGPDLGEGGEQGDSGEEPETGKRNVDSPANGESRSAQQS